MFLKGGLGIILVWISAVEPKSVPDGPVYPIYDTSLYPSFYKDERMVPEEVQLEELVRNKAVADMNETCMVGANKAVHGKNRFLFNFPNITGLRSGNNYLFGTTYWMNDYLHVGHVHYDIVLVQILHLIKIDRIVMQRAVCHDKLCQGLGVLDSYYKGYFAAVLEAAGQPNVPVYLRWTATPEVKPFYFSTSTQEVYYQKREGAEDPPHITLQHTMCTQRNLQRTNLNYGETPTVGAKAVKKFKEVAYKLARRDPPLPTYFDSNPPYTVLVSYRGPQASRHTANIFELIENLKQVFPAPDFNIKCLNNSDSQLDFRAQILAVAEAHVIITNHGAFEGNMIYMRNSSLLIEIFGDYWVGEVMTFHRLAMMWGLHYARLHASDLKDHAQSSFTLQPSEIADVINITKEYFRIKPFLKNLKISS